MICFLIFIIHLANECFALLIKEQTMDVCPSLFLSHTHTHTIDAVDVSISRNKSSRRVGNGGGTREIMENVIRQSVVLELPVQTAEKQILRRKLQIKKKKTDNKAPFPTPIISPFYSLSFCSSFFRRLRFIVLTMGGDQKLLRQQTGRRQERGKTLAVMEAS